MKMMLARTILMVVVMMIVIMMMVATITTAVRHVVGLLEGALRVRAYVYIHCI
jgi:hypothetical protein